MKYAILYISLIVSVLQTGCETEAVDVKTPGFEQKLVIAGFISPSDTTSYLSISSNWELFGNIDTEHSTGKLTGTISDGINSIQLDTFRLGLKFNRGEMSIDYGKTYYLKIQSDLGLSAEATCRIPEKRSFVIEYDTAWIKSKYNFWSPDEKTMTINITYKDIPGEANFYNIRLKGRAWGKDPYGYTGTTIIDDFGPCRSDVGLDATVFSLQKDTHVTNHYKLDSANIVIYLLHTEESYYLYHKSLENYDRGDNPFSEPTPVFSNITGGLGIFTSYTVDSVILKIK